MCEQISSHSVLKKNLSISRINVIISVFKFKFAEIFFTKVSFHALERYLCSGPRPIKNGVLKVPCPFNSIIRDTTTPLARYYDNKLCTYGYYYPSRCEKCSALALQRKKLHRLRLLADDDAPVTCSHGACLLSRWQDAILCRLHLLKAFSDEKQNSTRQSNVIEVQKYIRSYRFKVTSKFRSVLDVLDVVGLQERRAW